MEPHILPIFTECTFLGVVEGPLLFPSAIRVLPLGFRAKERLLTQ